MFWKSFWSSVVFSLSWRVVFIVFAQTLISFPFARYFRRLNRKVADLEQNAPANDPSAKDSPETTRTASRFFLATLIRLFLLATLIAMLAPALVSGGSGLDFMGSLRNIVQNFLVAVLAFIAWSATSVIPLVGTVVCESDHVQDFIVGMLVILAAAARKGLHFQFTRDEAALVIIKLLIVGTLSILISIGIKKAATYIIAFGSQPFSSYEPTINAAGEFAYVIKPSGVTRVLSVVVLVITIWSRLFPVFWTSYYMMSQVK